MMNKDLENIFGNDVVIEPVKENEEGKLTINVKKQDIIDVYCLHGEEGVEALSVYVATVFVDTLFEIMRAIPEEQFRERRNELLAKMREEKDARNRNQ